MKLSEIRQKFPQYGDMPDEQLVIGLHRKFYSDMPFKDFNQKIEYDNKVNPTEGMGGVEKFVAGMGQGAARMGRAAGQGLGLVSDEQVAEGNRLDAPLLETGAGKAGSFTGSVATLAPAMLIPGANTYAGATAIGAVTGAATTEGGLKERAQGAALGAAGGAAGKFLGDKLGAGLTKIAEKSRTNALMRQTHNSSKDATLAAGREAGYVVPPSNVEGSSTAARIAEGLGGKIKTEQAASMKNAAVTEGLVRKSLGLADDAPLTSETLRGVRDQASQAYKAIADLPEQAAVAKSTLTNQPGVEGFKPKQALQELRQARNDATSWYNAYARSASPDDQTKAKAFAATAKELEDKFEKYAASVGRDDLLPALREARKLIAKTYTVEKALKDGSGRIDTKALVRQLEKGKPLTDELRLAAEFGQAYPKVNQLNQNVAPYSVLDMFGAGVGIGTNPLVTAGIAARPLARGAVLSSVGQRMAQPNYGGNALAQRLGSAAQTTPANMLLRTAPIGLVPANQ